MSQPYLSGDAGGPQEAADLTIEPMTTSTATTPENPSEKGICHFYGDPHVIIFPQRSGAFQHQYWCKTPGEYRILKNDYVQIIAIVTSHTYIVDEFIILFFEDNNTVLCNITDDEQTCNSPKIKITRPSVSQMDILYITPRVHISIVSHQHQFRWHDISIRMPYELIRRSTGLCVMPLIDNCELENSIVQNENTTNSLSKQICEEYLTASIQGSNLLNLPNNSERHNNALIACIHDYETTGDKSFGASIINMIIKHEINREQLDDFEFELKTVESIIIIENAVINANTQTDILLVTTTQTTATSIQLTSTTSTITSTTSVVTTTPSSLTLATTSDCSVTIKSVYILLISFLFSFYMKLFCL